MSEARAIIKISQMTPVMSEEAIETARTAIITGSTEKVRRAQCVIAGVVQCFSREAPSLCVVQPCVVSRTHHMAQALHAWQIACPCARVCTL